MEDSNEFIGLLNKHQNIVHKVCVLYMNNVADREDLFQEITLQAWNAFKNFRGESTFSTWLYRVALNTAISFYRKEKRMPQFTNTEPPREMLILTQMRPSTSRSATTGAVL